MDSRSGLEMTSMRISNDENVARWLLLIQEIFGYKKKLDDCIKK